MLTKRNFQLLVLLVIAWSAIATTGIVSTPPSTTNTFIAASFSAAASSTAASGAYGWIKEQGQQYGNVVIRNNCEEPLNLWSVGAWNLGGPRNDTAGWGTEEENKMQTITAGGTYTEPYRITCPIGNKTGEDKYCRAEDKLAGQGVSMKISRTQLPTPDILQFEYALVQDPNRGVSGDAFLRMNYDVSLLDCARADGVMDATGNQAQHQEKINMCPGYKDGISVTFGDNTTYCPPVYCDGKEKCMRIYTWDRTRIGEASLSCDNVYYGNMTVDLCVNKGNFAQQAVAQFNKWLAAADNLPSDISAASIIPAPSPGNSVVPSSKTSGAGPLPLSTTFVIATVTASGQPPAPSSINPQSSTALKKARGEPTLGPTASCDTWNTSTMNTCISWPTISKASTVLKARTPAVEPRGEEPTNCIQNPTDNQEGPTTTSEEFLEPSSTANADDSESSSTEYYEPSSTDYYEPSSTDYYEPTSTDCHEPSLTNDSEQTSTENAETPAPTGDEENSPTTTVHEVTVLVTTTITVMLPTSES